MAYTALSNLILRDCLTDDEKKTIQEQFTNKLPPDAVTGSQILFHAFDWCKTKQGGEYWLSVFKRLHDEEREAIKNINGVINKDNLPL